MRAASALSTHPVAAIALGEAAGQVLDALAGARPALVLVAVTPPHLGTLDDVGAALQALLAPDVVVGAVASAVIGGGGRVEGEPALALFAVAGLTAAPLAIVPHLRSMRVEGSLADATAAFVLADPFSDAGVAASLAAVLAAGGVPTTGGLVGSPGQGPGGSRLLLDGVVHTSGAVGALLGPPARAVASQGWSPAGEPWVVTRSEGDVVLELGGRPAAERRDQALGDPDEVAALGVLVDDHAEEPTRANLLPIPILGSGPTDGLRVASPLRVGWVVRFLRTGPVHLEADLAAALAPSERPTGVLLFPGSGRAGDADLTSELLGCPVAGIGVSVPLGAVGRVAGKLSERATGVLVFP